jgi:hypothetical protein
MTQTSRNRSGDKRQATPQRRRCRLSPPIKKDFPAQVFTSSRAAQNKELRATSSFTSSSSLHHFGRLNRLGKRVPGPANGLAATRLKRGRLCNGASRRMTKGESDEI